MLKAADIMAQKVICVSPDQTVQGAAALMLDHGVSGLPVVDASGKLVGVVSEGDLMRHVEAGTDHHRSWWLRALMGHEELAKEYVRENARHVRDVMTKTVVTASPDTPARNLAETLEHNGIKRVPIVKDGAVVGIVSRANLLRALARSDHSEQTPKQLSDEELRQAVMARFGAEPWARTTLINVDAHEGAVTLSGIVDSIAEQKALRLAAELTEGVRTVEDATMIRPIGV